MVYAGPKYLQDILKHAYAHQSHVTEISPHVEVRGTYFTSEYANGMLRTARYIRDNYVSLNITQRRPSSLQDIL